MPPVPRHPAGHSVVYMNGSAAFTAKPNMAYGYDERVLKKQRETVLKKESRFWQEIEKRKRQQQNAQLKLKQKQVIRSAR